MSRCQYSGLSVSACQSSDLCDCYPQGAQQAPTEVTQGAPDEDTPTTYTSETLPDTDVLAIAAQQAIRWKDALDLLGAEEQHHPHAQG